MNSIEGHRQKIQTLLNMVQEKENEIAELEKEKDIEKSKYMAAIKRIDDDIKAIHKARTVYLKDIANLKGESLTENNLYALKGMNIGNEAIKVLERLGRKMHYTEIKEELEKFYAISGINDKSKLDSVWNQLDRRTDVERLGGGYFRLKK